MAWTLADSKMEATTLPSAAEAKAALVGELRRQLRILASILIGLWLIHFVNALAFQGHLAQFGLFPRTTIGLRGILFAPLLHGSTGHLVGNTIGISLLGGLTLAREERDFWIVTGIGALGAGLGVWLFGRSVLHIGASGVIFAYFGYLLSTGVFERRLGSILLSVVTALLWGSFVFGVLPGQRGISWEGHLSGLLAGIVAAWLIARRPRSA